MRVRYLIEQLRKLDPDDEVYVERDGSQFLSPILSVEKTPIKVIEGHLVHVHSKVADGKVVTLRIPEVKF